MAGTFQRATMVAGFGAAVAAGGLLAIAAAAAACGDQETARRLLAPVERRSLVRRNGMVHLDLNREWRIGATAMYFHAVSRLVRNPIAECRKKE